jgi:hypothetical protein
MNLGMVLAFIDPSDDNARARLEEEGRKSWLHELSRNPPASFGIGSVYGPY